VRFIALLVALFALLLACADDDSGGGEGGGSGGDGGAGAEASSTSACADCRTVAIGTELQAGDTSVGVLTCDDTTCAVSVAEPDGTETGLDLAVGDTLDAGAAWVVVATGTAGLTLRPA
jgi:hypothetical protein